MRLHYTVFHCCPLVNWLDSLAFQLLSQSPMPLSPYPHPSTNTLRLLLLSLILFPFAYSTLRQFIVARLSQRAKLSRTIIFRHSAEFSVLSSYLYSLLDEYSGGPLQNASVHSCHSIVNSSQRVLFCVGGWTGLKPTHKPFPMYTTEDIAQKAKRSRSFFSFLFPFSSSSSSADSLPSSEPVRLFGGPKNEIAYLQTDVENYWLTKSLGKSLLFNGAMAFLLAVYELESNHGHSQSSAQQKNTKSSQPNPAPDANTNAAAAAPLTFRHQSTDYTITSFEFCFGRWLSPSVLSGLPVIKVLLEMQASVSSPKLSRIGMSHK